ncbi:MAG TPA: NAD(P)H-hydrate epimerase [Tepidisphaeraceae bacterium]|nr:NAD(P)H-hydrate epimerase [Tepidisphaeraceae bacterium]
MLRLTRDQVRKIDRLAVEKYKIPSVILMENAARAAADAACSMVKKSPVLIVCGGGNNGGDGLTVARHLHNRGYQVTIALATDPAKYHGDAKVNWDIAQAMSLPTIPAEQLQTTHPALLIDAIFGTGLTDPPRPPFAEYVKMIAALNCPVLAIDIPSGLDCDTGKPLGACVVATRTITFVAEKVGFASPEAAKYLGQVTVGDIGSPPELIEMVRKG